MGRSPTPASAREDSQDSSERAPCRPEGTQHQEATVPETRRSFDDQLTDIRTSVVTLAAKSCEQIGAATQALLDADLPLVERIYAAHREIEGLVLREVGVEQIGR